MEKLKEKYLALIDAQHQKELEASKKTLAENRGREELVSLLEEERKKQRDLKHRSG